jgi:hypothetical protein
MRSRKDNLSQFGEILDRLGPGFWLPADIHLRRLGAASDLPQQGGVVLQAGDVTDLVVPRTLLGEVMRLIVDLRPAVDERSAAAAAVGTLGISDIGFVCRVAADSLWDIVHNPAYGRAPSIVKTKFH